MQICPMNKMMDRLVRISLSTWLPLAALLTLLSKARKNWKTPKEQETLIKLHYKRQVKHFIVYIKKAGFVTDLAS